MNFVQTLLKANAKRFTAKQYQALMTIAANGGYDYRKEYEFQDHRIPYLPSFIQRVESKLAAIGLFIDSRSANDGSRRKIYSIVPLKQNAPDQ
ncbi:hypothetical protein L2744_18400 [Shewanella profunda]|uniref:hypothetical protein n=1 Tax=Shewanella profunda TaxID=254793 RepID=UPI00200EA82E|nr:hypothetical protein [Shewanella profunda]MCL1091533.1 hypothetical protein [Shewanella profunda]